MLPVYRQGMPHSTIQQRRSALLGFIYAPSEHRLLLVQH
jgi:hypothetical protein